MRPWAVDKVEDYFLQQIDLMNKKVDTYSKLCNAFSPILAKYAKYFSSVSVDWEKINLTLKEDCDIPPLYCECDLAGLSAILKESKYDTFDYHTDRNRYNEYRTIKTIVNRNMEIRLK